MAENSQQDARPVKFTLTHHRKAGITHEAFMKWIVEVHLPKAIPVFQRHGVIGYALFDTPPAFSDALREKMAPIRPTWEYADFDCFIEYTVPSPQTIDAVMADPDWDKAVEDQDDWVEISKALLSLGYHTDYLAEGKVVDLKQ